MAAKRGGASGISAEGRAGVRDAPRGAGPAEEATGAFLSSMSHELRTPLNAILGYSEMLREEARSEGLPIAADLDRIHAAGRQLLALVEDVLDLARIEAGRTELAPEPFDVAELVREVAEAAEPAARKGRNRLEVVCPPTVGELCADPARVRQSLFALLSNACRFTEDGLVRLRVAGHGTGASSGVTFEVSDTGPGMSPEELSGLFRPFAQVDGSPSRRHGGPGLGLALARRLCRLMGGDVSVTSEPGRGSVFTIELPRRSAEPRSRPGPGSPPQRSSAVEAPLVLVIDDDPAVRGLLAASLAREGCRVAEAESAEEGLALAFRLSPALITLDALLPGVDGWAVLSALKADPDTAGIPVVMASMAPALDAGFVLGPTELVTRPIDRARLRRVVAEVPGLPGAALVAVPDASSRSLSRRILAERGWTALEAEDGRGALAALAAARPRLVLLDPALPELDALELLVRLRRPGAGPGVRVVVVSDREPTAATRKRLAGAVERILVRGGVTPSQLLEVVRESAARSLDTRSGPPGPDPTAAGDAEPAGGRQ